MVNVETQRSMFLVFPFMVCIVCFGNYTHITTERCYIQKKQIYRLCQYSAWHLHLLHLIWIKCLKTKIGVIMFVVFFLCFSIHAFSFLCKFVAIECATYCEEQHHFNATMREQFEQTIIIHEMQGNHTKLELLFTYNQTNRILESSMNPTQQ